MFIVSIGALDLGFAFIGPFASRDEAQTWTDENIASNTPFWDVLELKNPIEAKGCIKGVILNK